MSAINNSKADNGIQLRCTDGFRTIVLVPVFKEEHGLGVYAKMNNV